MLACHGYITSPFTHTHTSRERETRAQYIFSRSDELDFEFRFMNAHFSPVHPYDTRNGNFSNRIQTSTCWPCRTTKAIVGLPRDVAAYNAAAEGNSGSIKSMWLVTKEETSNRIVAARVKIHRHEKPYKRNALTESRISCFQFITPSPSFWFYVVLSRGVSPH